MISLARSSMAGVLVGRNSHDLQPVDAEVTILFSSSLEPRIPPVQVESSRRLNACINQAGMVQPVPDPIRLRGVGTTTLFGLNSRFEDDFPSSLTGKVAVEEFQSTINRLNAILLKSIPLNLKCLLFGCLCCCCTLGLSLGPVFYLNKRTRSRIDKFLESENLRLYNKLGLNLRLHCDQTNTSSNLREHVILIEFLPKIPLFWPD